MKFIYPVSMSTLAVTLLAVSPLSATIQTTLGSAADFTVLAGTITSVAVPIKFSNGDVGGTSVVGGPTVDAGFEIIMAPDGRLAPANAALLNAQNNLRALELSQPFVNLSGMTLSGMTLTPGVYKFDVAAEFTNGTTLKLDAGGLNGGVWVFNIGTSLTTAALAGVEVINLGSNQGSDLEIYWNAGAGITIGANNTIIGNYLAGTSINVGTTMPSASAFASGRALAQAAVSFDGNATLDALGPVYLSYVLLSVEGTYTQGDSDVVLASGVRYTTGRTTLDGNSSDTAGAAASLTVFKAIATLTGTNTFTGGIIIDGGTLITSTANLPVNGPISVNDNGTFAGKLVFDQTIDGTFGGTITGTGTIQKLGSGAVTLASTTTSAIDLQAGSLVLAGGGVGTTTVASGAVLRGNGTINGNLFNNGTVSPGNSPGTIIVTGNYSQGSGGTFVAEIASEFSFDRLVATGSANLDGTLAINILNGYNPDGKSFEIIQAAGGVIGTFASDNSAALESTVSYGANNVVITFTQLAFATLVATPNQVAIANAAQLSPAITTVLNAVPLASQLPAAINAISPQGYAVWSDLAFAHTASLGERLNRHTGTIEGHDDYYFEAGQSRGIISRDPDLDSSRYTSESGLVGGNHYVSENLTLGGFFEYTETNSGMGSPGSSTTVKSKMPGIRAAWKQNAWFANAAVAYGFDDHESTRAINFPGTSATAKSETSGRQWLMDLTAGRRFQAGLVSLSPFAGLQASGWKAKGFTETGAGVFNATVDTQRTKSLRTQLGLEAAISFNIGSVVVSPHARAAWIHELENESRSINGSIDGASFTATTRDPQRDSARLSAGFDVAITPTVALYADYAIQTGDRTRVVGEWRAGLGVSF